MSSGEVQPVSLWRNRGFVLLQSGQTISTLGSSISGLAFLFLVLALTHSPVQAGLITSVRALPFLLLAFQQEHGLTAGIGKPSSSCVTPGVP